MSVQSRAFRQRHIKLVALILVGVAGCGYGEVSQTSYDYVSALHSICNRQDSERLEAFATQFEQACQAGEVSTKEAEWINGIVEQARAGEWTDATAEARQIMLDQVEGGP